MQEMIVLAPGANEAELLRSMARSGINSIGTHVMGSTGLAGLMLMRSGIGITERFLTNKEAPSVIFSFLDKIDYFSAASYADAENLARALSTARSLITGDEEVTLAERLSGGEFAGKNSAIIEVYRRYMEELSEDGRIDGTGLIRKAATEADPVKNMRFAVLKEFPLTPLEKALLDKASGGTYEQISLLDLFGKEEKDPSGIVFTEAYGEINEVKDILTSIYSSGRSFDECVIACADTSAYAQIIYDLACRYDLPVTYGCGLPVMDSCPGVLLRLINDWRTTGFYGIDALRNIIFSDAFDRKRFASALGMQNNISRRELEDLAVMAGSLRLSFDAEENRRRIEDLRPSVTGERDLKTLAMTEALAEELSHGCSYLISHYGAVRNGAGSNSSELAGRIDRSALKAITESLDAYTGYGTGRDIGDIIPEILRKTVCSENSREGHLHVTGIRGALSVRRSELYVCGMSSASFPGTPSENYLLLDSDLLLLSDSEDAPTSETRIRNNLRMLDALISTAASLDIGIHISYPGYSLSELKDQNPSSALYSLYEKTDPGSTMEKFMGALRHTSYFDSPVSSDRLAGQAYAHGTGISHSRYIPEAVQAEDSMDRAWSPSALEVFRQCPRRFYLTRVLRIPEPETDNPFDVLNAAETGTLAHSLMEDLADVEMSREEFTGRAADAFDEAMRRRPPVHPADAGMLKNEFIKMMGTAYDTDPHNEVLSAEDSYTFTHPSGITLHGYPDRVERDGEGKYLIADFKTKRKTDHIEDDFDTCLQVIVYAWLCEQAGIDISGCEYRYMRKGKTVTCRYDDDMKEKLADFLASVREAFETGDFPRVERRDNCRYCGVSDICVWPEGMSGEEA